MATTCQTLLSMYLDSAQERFRVDETEFGCRFATPFYLPDNTRLTVLINQPENGYVVSDSGETIDHLYLGGVTIEVDDPRLKRIGDRFAVKVDQGELSKVASATELPHAIDAVVQAVLDTAYLVYTRTARKPPTFSADVEHFLASRTNRYRARPRIQGETGLRRFDYQLTGPEQLVLLDLLSVSTNQAAHDRSERIAFRALDVRPNLESPTKIICLLDDRSPVQRETIDERVWSTLDKYLDGVVWWSDRRVVDTFLDAA